MFAGVSKILYRSFHGSASCVAANLSKTFNKFLYGSKKKWYPHSEPLPQVKQLGASDVKKEPGRKRLRRLAILSKMFMQHISDQMSCGEIGEKVQHLGIEISKIKVTPNYETVNVYWGSRNDVDPVETQNILNGISANLQRILTQLNVLGKMPHIFFIRDKSQDALILLDEKLSNLDYGEDYKPKFSLFNQSLKSEFNLTTTLEPHIVEAIKKLDSNEENKEPEVPIPPMSSNVYNLNRSLIIQNIIKAKQKSQDAWNKNYTSQEDVQNTFKENIVENFEEDCTSDEYVRSNKTFKNFLKKRQIQLNKSLKDKHKLDNKYLNKEEIEPESHVVDVIYDDEDIELQLDDNDEAMGPLHYKE